jgi:hypothetical protein
MSDEGKHPAPFTDSIIDELAELIPRYAPSHAVVHDPFAGEGTKLAALCERLGYFYSGTDLEPWPNRDRRVQVGDSTDPSTYPLDWYVIVTSPTYNNGVNDHFEPKDDSRRLTYRSRAGHELHSNNTGRWSGRGSKKGETEYWRITRDVVKHWPDVALVNVKDSTRAGEIYRLTFLWSSLLEEYGYEVEWVDVPCPGWRYGANSQARVDSEVILVATRSTERA